jgi:hypothetical protein
MPYGDRHTGEGTRRVGDNGTIGAKPRHVASWFEQRQSRTTVMVAAIGVVLAGSPLLVAFGATSCSSNPESTEPRGSEYGIPNRPASGPVHDVDGGLEDLLGRMRADRAVVLTGALALDVPTAARLFPLLAHYDERSDDIGRKRTEIVRDLSRAVHARDGEKEHIEALVQALLANRALRDRLRQERFAALCSVLTPLQQGRLLLVLPSFERQARRRIIDTLRGSAGRSTGVP